MSALPCPASRTNTAPGKVCLPPGRSPGGRVGNGEQRAWPRPGQGARGLPLPRAILTRDRPHHGARRPPAGEAAVGATGCDQPGLSLQHRFRGCSNANQLSVARLCPQQNRVWPLGCRWGRTMSPSLWLSARGQNHGVSIVLSSVAAEMWHLGSRQRSDLDKGRCRLSTQMPPSI